MWLQNVLSRRHEMQTSCNTTFLVAANWGQEMLTSYELKKGAKLSNVCLPYVDKQ